MADQLKWSEEVRDALLSRFGGELPPCPMCKSTKWVNFLYDGDTAGPVVKSSVWKIENIPSAVIACQNCGFISMHALLVVMGTIDEARPKDEQQPD